MAHGDRDNAGLHCINSLIMNLVDMLSFRDTIELEKVLNAHAVSFHSVQGNFLKKRTFTVPIEAIYKRKQHETESDV